MFAICSMHPDSVSDHPLRFLFIDFNSYFAAVEQHDDPQLAGKPVIVIPIDSEHTGAIAASYEAKALGISRGTSVREARAICPGIAVRSARHDRYVEMHNRLMAEIENAFPFRAFIRSTNALAVSISANRNGKSRSRRPRRSRRLSAGTLARCFAPRSGSRRAPYWRSWPPNCTSPMG